MNCFQRNLLRAFAIVAAVILFASACADASDDSAAGDDGTTDGAVTEEAPPTETGSESVAAGDSLDGSTIAESDDGESAIEPIPDPEPAPEPSSQAGLLTAGAIDDNLNFEFFSGYRSRTAQNLPDLPFPDLSEWFDVRVLDTAGIGIANTSVDVRSGNEAAMQVFTNAAGRARIFPSTLSMGAWESLEVSIDGERAAINRADIGTEVSFTPAATDGGAPDALDIALVLDVTASMADELKYLTVEFESIVERARDAYPEADLRFALVSYRDVGDDFVTQTYDFTSDVSQMQGQLASQKADGGGDVPEAMDAALVDANSLDWRGGNVSRIMIVNADAPPHAEKLQATLGATSDAIAQGIRIYPLAASGVDETAEYIMRTMAVMTRVSVEPSSSPRPSAIRSPDSTTFSFGCSKPNSPARESKPPPKRSSAR